MADLSNSLIKKEEIPVCVIRLSTLYWHDKKGLHSKQSLVYLKRKCKLFNFLDEDCSMIGANEVFPKIINLSECEDGIYQVVICNEYKDFETGHIEDYDYKLIPYND